MWSYPDIEKYILKYIYHCICPVWLTDSEYYCPYCFTTMMYQISLNNIYNY